MSDFHGNEKRGTDYRDKLIDLMLSDELGGEDHSDRIDAVIKSAKFGTARQENEVNCAQPAAKSTGRSTRFIPILAGSIIAVAASVLILIWAVGWLPRDNSNKITDDGTNRNVNDDPQGVNRDAIPDGHQHGIDPGSMRLVKHGGFVAPADTQSASRNGVPVLQRGWVYATGDNARFFAGDSELKLVNARAVVVVGDVPSPYEAYAMSRMLNESELVPTKKDLNMLMNSKNWVCGFGVCMCLLAGQAFVDTDAIFAQETADDLTVEKVFVRYDTNSDGKLQMEECVCKGSKMCDANQDGIVTKDEFVNGVAKHCGSKEAAIKMINGMGGLEKFYAMAKSGELEKVMEVSMDKVFAQWDRNGNGFLEPEECVCKGSKMADADKDGKVTKEEMIKTAEEHFGSVEKFLDMVRQGGGVEAFYNKVATEGCTIGSVFARYDKNQNGTLEPGECVCAGTKGADANGDGKVTKEEMIAVAKKHFGSLEKFEAFVKEQGGAEKFFEAAKAGTLKVEKN